MFNQMTEEQLRAHINSMTEVQLREVVRQAEVLVEQDTEQARQGRPRAPSLQWLPQTASFEYLHAGAPAADRQPAACNGGAACADQARAPRAVSRPAREAALQSSSAPYPLMFL